jgi:hypothetical protein
MAFDVAAAHPDCLPRFLGSFTAEVFIFTARHHFFRLPPRGGAGGEYSPGVWDDNFSKKSNRVLKVTYFEIIACPPTSMLKLKV